MHIKSISDTINFHFPSNCWYFLKFDWQITGINLVLHF